MSIRVNTSIPSVSSAFWLVVKLCGHSDTSDVYEFWNGSAQVKPDPLSEMRKTIIPRMPRPKGPG
jgi:hypothetical protein